MIRDFPYIFPGFHGIESKCHIRIVSEEGKATVIVCSQAPDNKGTSVQNAYEIIRDIVKSELKDKNSRKVFSASLIDEFADQLEKTEKFKVAIALFLLRQSSKVLRDEKTLLDIFKKQDIDIVWVEHWPLGTGLLQDESDYYLVKENETGSPSWHRININSFSKGLGYQEQELEKFDEIFA